MTYDDSVHWDVAAYALGILDAGDTARFEEHLIGCAECARELEALLPTVELMSEVDIDLLEATEAAETPRIADGLLAAVSADRARRRRRQSFALAASVLVAASVSGFALFAGANLLRDDVDAQVTAIPTLSSPPLATPGPQPGIGGPELGDGDRFSATDSDTGVHADVVLHDGPFGTSVSFALSSVTGPLVCRLLIVQSDGSVEVASTWRVPEPGYGTAEQPEPLLLQTATALSPDEIDRIQVQAVDEQDEISTLVSVPLT